MRIAVSNPDNIGDFVVRQPMLAALLEAGHEVFLIVRTHVAPIAAWCLPGAKVVQCAGNPYAERFDLKMAPDDRLIEAVKAFDPDLFVVAPYQHTQMEEQLAECLPRASVIGFGGELRQNDSARGVTHVSKLRWAVSVQVGRDWPEVRKNELLCGAILGRNITLPVPRLEAEQRFLDTAAERLRREGIRDRKYWVVCAGEGSEYTRLKNWPLEKWAELCSTLVKEHELHLVFVGTSAEHETTAAIRAQMGELAQNTLDMTAQPDGLDMLVGLLAYSSGYLGKDTGPMHIAASLGKPVVAVFGGGHWPRFLPSPEIGRVVTMQVPCMDCDWVCPYKTSHCVKAVPVAAVLDAVRAVLEGKQSGFETVLLEQEPWVARTMALEAAETARASMLALTVERSNFHQWHSDRVTDIEGLRKQISVLETQKSEFGAERQGWTQAIQQLRDETARLAAERVDLQGSLSERAEAMSNSAGALAELARLRLVAESKRVLERRFSRFQERALRKLAESQGSAATLRRELQTVSATAAEATQVRDQLQQRLDAMLSRIRSLEGEKVSAVAELEQEKNRLDLECTDRAAALDVAGAKLDLLESRYQGTIADLRQQLKRAEADLHTVRSLVPDLRTELTQSLAELARLQDEAIQLTSDKDQKAAWIEQLETNLAEVEFDRAKRLELIQLVSAKLAAVEKDQAAKQELIEQVEFDQREKQSLIERLSETITEIEGDRAARLELIEKLSVRLRDVEADQQAKQKLIVQISSQLAEVEADRAERGRQIEVLDRCVREREAEIAALRAKLMQRLTKWIRPS